MTRCEEIQQKLEQLEANQALTSAADLKHIQSCQHCHDYLLMCEAFNSSLCELGESDADDELVESTLNSILTLQQQDQQTKTSASKHWANALAASFMLVSLVSLFPYNSLSRFDMFSEDSSQISESLSQQNKERYFRKEDYVEHEIEFLDLDDSETSVIRRYRKLTPSKISTLSPDAKPPMVRPPLSVGSIQVSQVGTAQALTENFNTTLKKEIKSFSEPSQMCCQESEGQDKVKLDKVVTTGSHIRASDLDSSSPEYVMEMEEYSEPQKKDARKTAKTKAKRQKQESVLAGVVHNVGERKSFNRLTFQQASGYWANSYLPGDSKMRSLRVKLEQNKVVDINNSVSQNIQPFDAPENAALAVYLSSDKAFVNASEPSRMHLQVGIQAANRKGGHRSALNMALIFDLNKADINYLKQMKTLLMALLNSKQAGDKISLTVAGASVAMQIKPEDFRHGPIQVVLQNLRTEIEKNKGFSDDSETNAKQNIKEFLPLNQAIESTYRALQQRDDPSKSLGTSMVLLFSATTIDDVKSIETLVHKRALAGITLSTVSMSHESRESLNQLALAGQGHSRLLLSESDAKRVIDAELLASSRAVARALRLRIRLAKGVKLIRVLDSYNLNEQQSQRVRDAEASLDLRLSKNTGIASDRGEDEEGIQIVIPSFYAGDTHVILLDVMVTKPGALADVSLRYKDLLYLRNALTQKQLNLGSRIKAIGPIERNVIKNVLAHYFASSIDQASQLLRDKQTKKAIDTLLSLQDLYQSKRIRFPIWNKDAEIQNDEALLQQYIQLLKNNAIDDRKQINYIADSMQYSSWRKNTTNDK